MKRAKKMLSLLFAMIMVFAMATTVFAANANEHTITITNEKSGHTYSAYQVFAGDISNGKLTNIQWGSGVNGDDVLTELKVPKDSLYANCMTAEDVADVLAGFNNNSEQLDDFAKVVGKHLTTAAGSSAEQDSPYTIKVTENGYYFVKDTGTIDGNDAATKYILEVVGDVTVKAKAEVPDIDKAIVNADSANGGDGKGTAQDVGSVVNFKLTSTVPEMDGYTSYTYIVEDTLSDGLTFNDDVAVTIGGTEYTDFTVNQNGQSFTITFHNFINQKQNAGNEIVITYSATINEKALVTNKEENTVDLKYSNNPNDDSSRGTTPKKKVYIYDFDLVIDKYTGDKTTGDRLEGAKFVLYKASGDTKQYYKYNETQKKVEWTDSIENAEVVTTDANGAAKFQGLDSGTYYLHETEAPAGYNLLKEDVEVIITATYNGDGTLASSSATSINDGQYQQVNQIENKSGATLPSTGGMGTTVFYVLGGILVAGATILLVTKKRMSASI